MEIYLRLLRRLSSGRRTVTIFGALGRTLASLQDSLGARQERLSQALALLLIVLGLSSRRLVGFGAHADAFGMLCAPVDNVVRRGVTTPGGLFRVGR